LQGPKYNLNAEMGSMPFTYELSKRHFAKLHDSDATTPRAVVLQQLVSDTSAYESKLEEFGALGYKFRLTDGKVYEISEGKKTCELSIKFQVKGSVITWAFIAPRDETYQEFRDLLYGSAAKAHDKVEAGCEKYYRGSDSYHLKKMHTSAQEAGFNHNHYRLSNGLDVTPKEVAEHLREFVNLPHGKFFFPDVTEVDAKGVHGRVSDEVESVIKKFTVEEAGKLRSNELTSPR
jgi:hypothetical protein